MSMWPARASVVYRVRDSFISSQIFNPSNSQLSRLTSTLSRISESWLSQFYLDLPGTPGNMQNRPEVAKTLESMGTFANARHHNQAHSATYPIDYNGMLLSSLITDLITEVTLGTRQDLCGCMENWF